jgi:hypothetical protein
MGTFIEEVAADFRDPLTILMEREGYDADDVHSGWTSGRARTRIHEFEMYTRTENEPNVDKTATDEMWQERQHFA